MVEAYSLQGLAFTNGSGFGYGQFMIQSIMPQQGGGIYGTVRTLKPHPELFGFSNAPSEKNEASARD